VGADASEELNNSFVVAGGDSGFLENRLTKMGIDNAECEFLFFASFSSREMSGKEALQSGGHLVRCDGLHVLKRLFGSLERLVGRNSHHFGEAFQ
jgi:hypothetical protein